jgi:hypothetical protein
MLEHSNNIRVVQGCLFALLNHIQPSGNIGHLLQIELIHFQPVFGISVRQQMVNHVVDTQMRKPQCSFMVMVIVLPASDETHRTQPRIDLMWTDGNQMTNSPKKKGRYNLAALLVEEQSETSISLFENRATFTEMLQPHRQTSLTELDRFPSQQIHLQTVRNLPSRSQPASCHHPECRNARE